MASVSEAWISYLFPPKTSSRGTRMKIQRLNSNNAFDKLWVIGSLLVVLALVLCSASGARAQVTTADVRGTIMDEMGAAVAGADVSISNAQTGLTRNTKSGSDGTYSFTELPLGTYNIHVTHAGFKAETQTGIALHVNDSLVVNVGLRVGAISESVTVEASPVAVETTSGELTGLIQASQVSELPLNGRNFMQLITLVPGVAPAEAFSVTNKGLKGASDVSVSGSPSNGNQWLVDGANNNDTGSQRTILIYPSTESIEEFKIERNSYGAEFGLMAGATISLVTKSGSNDFHGSAYYSGRNDKLNAYDTELKAGCPTPLSPVTCPKNKFRGNDYGFTIGGPVKKGKVFFFYSEEWNKRIEGLTATNHVPTMAERGGDFSDVAACAAAGVGGTGYPTTGLHDPAAAPGTYFGNVIAPGRLDATGQLLLSEYPAPTLAYTPTSCPNLNWTASQNVPTPWREENARGDINLTKTLTLMLKFTNDSWQIGPPSNGFGWGSNSLGVIDESWNQPGRIAAAKLSKTIGSNAVNDFQFSYSANRITINPSNLALETSLNDAMPTFFPLAGKRYGDKGPSVWYSGWGNAHLPSVWTISPWANAQDLYTWQDDFSIVKGRHTLKFGGIFSKNSKNEQQSNAEFGNMNGAVGYLGCNGATKYSDGTPIPSCPNAAGNTTGYDVADQLLQGMAFNWSEASNININDIRWRNTEFYGADTFRLTNRLTVVYGVRYSLLPNPYFNDDLYTSFNPAAYNPALKTGTCNGLLYPPDKPNPCATLPGGAAVNGGMPGPNRALWNNNNHMFAPRFSIAYDPTGKGKWAIRAGAGQFFNRDRLYALQIGGANPPFIGNFTTTNGRFADSIAQPGACAPNGVHSAGCFGQGLGNAAIGGETSNQMPNSWQYNLTVQHELFHNAVLEVGYVGNHNVHWEIRSDINAVPEADRLAFVQDQGNAALQAAFRPFNALKGNNSLTYYTRNASSSYNALQALFNMRFTRNSIFQVAYTWSKLISDTQLIDTPALNVDHNNPSASRGPDLLNRPQILVANVIYNLPTLQDQQKFVRGALGSWEVSGIVNLATGPSLTPVISSIQGVSDPWGLGSTGLQRPVRVPGQPCRASGSDGRQWLNPNAYTMNGFMLGSNGTSGVGICQGPGNSDVDSSLRKNFKLTERVKMQFQFDFFNLFNHPQYQASALTMGLNFNAVNTVASPEFKTASGAGTTNIANAVSIQNTTLTPGTFGYATQARENGWRQMQYGLKFSF
jgi:hypothetical protein